MPDDLQSYLAKKYGASTSTAKSEKKKKKKEKTAASTNARVQLVDEDEIVNDTWRQRVQNDNDDFRERIDNEDEAPVVVGFRDITENDDELDGNSRKRRRGSISEDERQPRTHRRASTSRSPPRNRSVSRSPPRNRSASRSPPRRRRHSRSPSPARRRHDDADETTHKPQTTHSGQRMADGSAAGLQTAASIKADVERKRREEDERLKSLSKELSGRDAETVYRDKHGRKVDLEVERVRQREQERQREAALEKQMQWGKGLVQQREQEALSRRERLEKSLPMAIYSDNAELNAELMTREHWDDPMKYLTKDKKKSSKRPEYTGPPPPPNRFGIKPGYRWDGVDRGNGFEAEYFKRKNEAKFKAEMSYRMGAEDM